MILKYGFFRLLLFTEKPYFKEEPQDITVHLGDSAIFHCDVDGMPTPTIDWYRQDAQMPKDRADRIVGGLKIRDARPEDEGLYFCQSSNELGSVRASALLSVHGKSLWKYLVYLLLLQTFFSPAQKSHSFVQLNLA